MRYLIFIIIFVTKAFALPTHWSVGINAAFPTGAWNSSNPYDSKGTNGRVIELGFGQMLSPKIGYNIGYQSTIFESNKSRFVAPEIIQDPETGLYYISDVWPEPNGWIERTYYGISLGVNYAVTRNNFDLYANATFGQYIFRCNRTPGLIELGGTTYAVSFNSEEHRDTEVFGFEVGARKKIRWGLWGQVYYHYTPLDKKISNVSSIQYVGVGLKYYWGRR